jgi:hypothetical protein
MSQVPNQTSNTENLVKSVVKGRFVRDHLGQFWLEMGISVHSWPWSDGELYRSPLIVKRFSLEL